MERPLEFAKELLPDFVVQSFSRRRHGDEIGSLALTAVPAAAKQIPEVIPLEVLSKLLAKGVAIDRRADILSGENDMRQLQIVGDSKYGGDSFLAVRFALAAKQRGWEVEVRATDPPFAGSGFVGSGFVGSGFVGSGFVGSGSISVS